MSQGITRTVLVSQPSEVGLFSGRLDYATTTTIKLNPNNGRYIEVNGYLMDIATSLTLSSADNLIDSSGAVGGTTSIETSYYVYISNAVASYAPGSLRASGTAPSLSDGVYYLGTAENARNWRFVGWINLITGKEFVDSDTQRRVVSYYNRKPAKLFTCPAYTNNDTITTHDAPTSNWAEANGAIDHRLKIIGNGEDTATYFAYGVGRNAHSSRGVAIGIGLEDTGSTRTEAHKELQAVSNSLGNLVCSDREVVVAGTLRTVYLLTRRVSGITATLEADGSRNGGSVDPYRTYMMAEVMI